MSKARHPWDGFIADRIDPLSPEEESFFRGRRVLITGAGGYLGSALARTLARLGVSRILLLDTAEYGLYRLEQALPQSLDRQLILGSVTDAVLLRELFCDHAPDLVFHAAALKHVPLLETNSLAAAEINVLGTEALLHEARQHSLTSFVLLSTDKAVVPSSIMGATKRLAEQLVLREHAQGHTVFRAARLCNVLGSTGSVAPLFARQIAAGRPLTVTHPEASRYFLSRTDAVRLLLRAATLDPTHGLLAPEVGAPHRVEDLALFLREQAPGPARSQITYTGLRPADKLHEQLMGPDERAHPYPGRPDLFAIQSSSAPIVLAQALREIRAAVARREAARLLRAIEAAVPEYTPLDLPPDAVPREPVPSAI